MFTYGLGPALAVVLAFKFRLSPPNDIFARPDVLLEHLMQPGRYAKIGSYFVHGIATFGLARISPLIAAMAYLMYAGQRPFAKGSASQQSTIALLAFMLFGYYCVYVVTPLDLQWHLDGSFPRLLIQLWPAFVFCVAGTGLRFGTLTAEFFGKSGRPIELPIIKR